MGVMRVSCFSMRHTFESAQPIAFHADYDAGSNSVTYATPSAVIRVSHRPQSGRASGDGALHVSSVGARDAAAEVRRRFRLSDDMRSLYRKIDTDGFMHGAISSYRGMRLTLSDPWETTLCFIISQFNNVGRIRRIVRAIQAKYGKPIYGPDGAIAGNAFPSAEDLRGATEVDLLRCGTGFRARYIRGATEYLTQNADLDGLRGKSYPYIRDALREMDGVGGKVADCIALMGYGKLEAFPIDVWVKRIVEEVYFGGRPQKTQKILDFAADTWGNLAGYAQQYLFWAGRQSGIGTEKGKGK